jgi:hypothetical protein
MNDEMVERLAMATRIACTAITTPRLTNLQASVNQASAIPAGFSPRCSAGMTWTSTWCYSLTADDLMQAHRRVDAWHQEVV